MAGCSSPLKLQEYVDGQLPTAEAEALAVHLQDCQRCRNVVRWLEAASLPLSALPRLATAEGLHAAAVEAAQAASPLAAVTCAATPELVSAYLDGELSDEETEALEAHIYACTECYLLYTSQAAMLRALRARPPETAPVELKERILVAVGQPQPRVIGRIGWRQVAAAVSAAAAAAALIFGLALQPSTQMEPAGPVVAVAPQAETQPVQAEPVQPSAPTAEASKPTQPSRLIQPASVRRQPTPILLHSESPVTEDVEPVEVAVVAPETPDSGPALISVDHAALEPVVRAPLARPNAPVEVPVASPPTLAPRGTGAELALASPAPVPHEAALAGSGAATPAVAAPQKAAPPLLVAQLPRPAGSAEGPRYISRQGPLMTVYRATPDDAVDMAEVNESLQSRLSGTSKSREPGIVLFR